ncbi:MAG TPA: hypothetical protein VLX56_06665 [Nitrososphaerales archaeon]|nr:hypothetical protein [Nitrososphaerales archaeon]
MSESRRRARVLHSSAGSAENVMRDRAAVAKGLADGATRRRLKDVAKPNSMTKTMRRAGVGLVLAPDPLTSVAGAVVIGASLAAKKRDPLSSSSVSEELARLAKELGSLL